MDFSGTEDSDVVAGDHLKGGRVATEYLIRLGHERIACITGPHYLEGSKAVLRGISRH